MVRQQKKTKYRKRMSSDEYDDKYYDLADEIEGLRDRMENPGHSRTKKIPKDLAQKLDEITERLKELDTVEVVSNPDDYDPDCDEDEEEENRKFDREMLADDIEELREACIPIQKGLAPRCRAETKRILRQARDYKKQSDLRAEKAELRERRINSLVSRRNKDSSSKFTHSTNIYGHDNWDDIPTADDMADAYEKTAKSVTYKSAGLYLLMFGLATPVGLIVTLVACVMLGINIGIAFLLWIGIIVWACIKLVDVNARAPKEYLKNLKKK